ncbi:MAG: alanine racemase [Acidimicrobiia bacterium]
MVPVLTNETTGPHYRPAWAEVDLDAVRHNTAVLTELAAPAHLMAVVKADGYGHGAVAVALAALESGATWLGVALVEEGIELREAGIEVPILLLSEPPPGAADVVVASELTPVVYTRRFIDALAKAAADAGRVEPLSVHLKVDTGMHRVGCDPADAADLARAVRRHGELALDGLLTHLAAADAPSESEFTTAQLDRFEAVRSELARARIRPRVVHAANSAGLLAGTRGRFSLVRCGIALYGIAPAPGLAGVADLRPALSLRARVANVRRLAAGERVSYGLKYRLDSESTVAVVPMGYADGVSRRLGEVGGEVLIGGRRRRIAGVVTMDQLMVDLGSDTCEPGAEVVLVGRQGDEEITAAEWAELLGTIPYEVCCAIGPRVPRRYRG